MADSANKRNIPIQFNRDFSVIDSEFSSIRERFDNEMRRMEDGKCFYKNYATFSGAIKELFLLIRNEQIPQ